jgi:hypothetical protein
MNAKEDGPREIADAVLMKVRARKCSVELWIAPNGMARIEPTRKAWRRDTPPPESYRVGVYTTRARYKDVCDDINCRLEEINATYGDERP